MPQINNNNVLTHKEDNMSDTVQKIIVAVLLLAILTVAALTLWKVWGLS